MFPERFSATFPAGEGNDLAGVATAAGPEISQFSFGDEVLGFSLRRGSHATHIAVPVAQLIRKPAQLSWEIAGSLFVTASQRHGVTAYAAVRAGSAASSCSYWCSARRGYLASHGPDECRHIAPPGCRYGTFIIERVTAAAEDESADTANRSGLYAWAETLYRVATAARWARISSARPTSREPRTRATAEQKSSASLRPANGPPRSPQSHLPTVY
jgi:hypothetical protein